MASIRSSHGELCHAFVSLFAQENDKIHIDGNDRVLTHLFISVIIMVFEMTWYYDQDPDFTNLSRHLSHDCSLYYFFLFYFFRPLRARSDETWISTIEV